MSKTITTVKAVHLSAEGTQEECLRYIGEFVAEQPFSAFTIELYSVMGAQWDVTITSNKEVVKQVETK